MSRRLACRAAKLWPDVIADLIAGYAEYTRGEKLRILVSRGGRRCIITIGRFNMEYLAAGGGVRIMEYGQNPINSWVSIHNVCAGIESGYMPLYGNPALTAAEIAELDVLLTGIE